MRIEQFLRNTGWCCLVLLLVLAAVPGARADEKPATTAVEEPEVACEDLQSESSEAVIEPTEAEQSSQETAGDGEDMMFSATTCPPGCTCHWVYECRDGWYYRCLCMACYGGFGCDDHWDRTNYPCP